LNKEKTNCRLAGRLVDGAADPVAGSAPENNIAIPAIFSFAHSLQASCPAREKASG
jgi:hypothetical protein